MISNFQSLLQRDVEQLSPRAAEFAAVFLRHHLMRNTKREDFSPIAAATDDYLARVESSIGVGIPFGTVVVGELGFPPIKQFTAIGDVVNVSARIEGQCKKLGAGILVSETVRAFLADEDFTIGPALEVALAGENQPVLVHSVEI